MRKRAWRSVTALLVVGAVVSPSRSQVDPDLLAGLRARSIGPAGMSGRVVSVEGVASQPGTFYVGSATGGLWKTVNDGLTFEPLFDDQQVHSIGAVAVFQASPEVVWVGTGEGFPRNSVSGGRGVYRSVDGGRTWTNLGLWETERIPRIVLHPTDPDVAYVAALGKAWGENSGRGVFKTTDAGATWERVLFVDERTGCADLVMDPRNPDKLFAAMWDYRRWPHSFRSGGPGSGLHVTRDGGATWTRLTPEDGLPEGDLGRIGLAIAPSAPDRVYALVEAEKNAVLRSDDGGVTWNTITTEGEFGNRPFYYSQLRVDPEWPQRVYSLHSLVTVSDDGGKSWEVLVPFRDVHPDHHAMWIDPNDPRHIIEGNDGGVSISHDRGDTWRFVSNLPLAQFYHVAVDQEVPYHVYGGMQDNGSWRGPSQVWENGGIRNHHWEEIGFGDGFAALPDPENARRGFSMSQEGYLMRWNLDTGERKRIRPWGPDDVELRFNWDAPIALDPFDSGTVYYGSQFLHVSRDRGDTWEIVSPDLTTNNPEWQRQHESGGLTLDVTGAENYTTLKVIAPSPLEPGLLWVGTDDGRVLLSMDGGHYWEALEERLEGVPANTWVPDIEPSRFSSDSAFVVLDNHRRSDWTPYVYRTDDLGQSFTRLNTDGVFGYALCLVQDPVQEELLYLGTETGLYISQDGGGSWLHFTHGLPTASVMSMVVHPRDHDLVIGTHGRAAFVLDDLWPLRSVTADVLAEPLHLFTIGDATQYQVKQTGASRFPGAGEYRGENRPYGALITFSVHGEDLPHPDEDQERARQAAKRAEAAAAGDPGEAAQETEHAEKAAAAEGAESAEEAGTSGEEGEGSEDEKPGDEKSKAEVTVKVRDAAGEVIREFTRPVHQGVNRIVWELHRDAFRRPGQGGRSGRRDRPGPEVLPGEYTVELTFGEHTARQPVRVRPDPRSPLTDAQRASRWALVLRAGALQERAADAVERIDQMRAHIGMVEKLAKEEQAAAERESKEAGQESAAGADAQDARPHAKLLKAARKLKRKLDEVDARFRTPDDAKGIVAEKHALAKLGEASGALGSSWDPPTSTEEILLAQGEAALNAAIAELNQVLAEDVASFREQVAASGLQLLPDRGAVE